MEMIELSRIIEDKTYPESGNDLFKILSEAIRKEEKVCIDMNNVISLPSLFLNSSLGRIIELYGYEKLRQSMAFRNINKSQANRIKEYTEKFNSILGK